MTTTTNAPGDLIAFCREVAALVRPLGYTLRDYRTEADDEVFAGAAAYRVAMRLGYTAAEVAEDIAFAEGGFAGLRRLVADGAR